MVAALSLVYGALAALVILGALYGVYAAGQRPSYMVDMREVAAYYRHEASNDALENATADDEE